MTLRTESDEELVARLRSHDEGALRELLVKYYVRLGAFSFSLLRRRDLAEEAVMKAFLNLWRRRESLKLRGPLKSYLFAAVGNQSFTLRKQQMRHAAVLIDNVPSSQLIDLARTGSDLLFNELKDEIDKLIMGLPPQRQIVFRMNRLEGLAYSEIAEALGVSERTVQNHMVQALKQLAPQLPLLRATLKRERTRTSFE